MKKLFFLLITMTMCFAGYSEMQFHHGVGANYLINIKKGATGSAVELVYHPRLTFAHSDNMSVGAGIPLGFGFQFQASSFGGSGGALLIDLPAMLDLNFGHGSSADNDKSVGGYVGVGFRYIYERIFGDFGGSAQISGPGMLGGIRFNTKNDLSFGVGVNYAYNLEGKSNVIGFGAMYNFK